MWFRAAAVLLWMAAGAASAAAADEVIVQGAGAAVALTDADMAQLPSVQVSAAFATEHGPRSARFEGPLLWDVLARAHAIDPAKPRDLVRESILLTGRDGYTAVLAMGEIAPAFEGKAVILAERMDGQALDHPRIVVPGDQRGGRSVHDLARLAVLGGP